MGGGVGLTVGCLAVVGGFVIGAVGVEGLVVVVLVVVALVVGVTVVGAVGVDFVGAAGFLEGCGVGSNLGGGLAACLEGVGGLGVVAVG